MLWSKSVEKESAALFTSSHSLRVQNDLLSVTMMGNADDICAERLKSVPRAADCVGSTSHLRRAAAGPHSNRSPLHCAASIAIVDMAADMSSDQLHSSPAHPAVYEMRLGGACGKKQLTKDTIRRIKWRLKSYRNPLCWTVSTFAASSSVTRVVQLSKKNKSSVHFISRHFMWGDNLGGKFPPHLWDESIIKQIEPLSNNTGNTHKITRLSLGCLCSASHHTQSTTDFFLSQQLWGFSIRV